MCVRARPCHCERLSKYALPADEFDSREKKKFPLTFDGTTKTYFGTVFFFYTRIFARNGIVSVAPRLIMDLEKSNDDVSNDTRKQPYTLFYVRRVKRFVYVCVFFVVKKRLSVRGIGGIRRLD